MNEQHQLSTFTRMACFFTQTDGEILAQCNRYEHSIINALFLRQLVTAALVFWALSYSVGTFLDGPQKWGIALLITMAFMFFDQAIIGSDWSLKGIYAEGNDSSGGRVIGWVLRLAFSLLLASALALPMELAIQNGPIQEKVQEMRRVDNEEFLSLIQAKDREIREGGEHLDRMLQRIRDELADKESHLARLRDARRAQEELAAEQALEMHYQSRGLNGRKQGKGPLWEEAELKKQTAETAIMWLTEEIARLDRELGDSKDKERELFQQQMSLDAKREAQKKDYADTLRDNGLFYETQDGLLTRYLGLQALHEDPVKGETAVMFSWAIKLVIITLELMPVLAKTVFGSAMVYTLLLITSRKKAAVRVIREQGQEIQADRHRYVVIDGNEQDTASRQRSEQSRKGHLAVAG